MSMMEVPISSDMNITAFFQLPAKDDSSKTGRAMLKKDRGTALAWNHVYSGNKWCGMLWRFSRGLYEVSACLNSAFKLGFKLHL